MSTSLSTGSVEVVTECQRAFRLINQFAKQIKLISANADSSTDISQVRILYVLSLAVQRFEIELQLLNTEQLNALILVRVLQRRSLTGRGLLFLPGFYSTVELISLYNIPLD